MQEMKNLKKSLQLVVLQLQVPHCPAAFQNVSMLEPGEEEAPRLHFCLCFLDLLLNLPQLCTDLLSEGTIAIGHRQVGGGDW